MVRRRYHRSRGAIHAAGSAGIAVTHLGKVFANRLSSRTEVVVERTGIAGLTGALAEELARNVRGVCGNRKHVVSVTVVFCGPNVAGSRHGLAHGGERRLHLLGGLRGPSNLCPAGIGFMLPLDRAFGGCMLRLPLRVWRNSARLDDGIVSGK